MRGPRSLTRERLTQSTARLRQNGQFAERLLPNCFAAGMSHIMNIDRLAASDVGSQHGRPFSGN